MVHDPEQATPLDGVVPLVLAGHTHERDVETLDDGTLLMVQGSTGGAGLRGLQGDYPEPLTCTVLYFSASTGRLQAYDDITLGGLGESEVTIERTVVPLEDGDGDDGGGGRGEDRPGHKSGDDEAQRPDHSDADQNPDDATQDGEETTVGSADVLEDRAAGSGNGDGVLTAAATTSVVLLGAAAGIVGWRRRS
jgi:hypothetical protein